MTSEVESIDSGKAIKINLFLAKYKLYIILIVIFAAYLLFQSINTAKKRDIAVKDAKSGLSLYKKGKFKAATTQLEESVKLNPNNAGAQLTLGHSYEASGKLDKAVKAYKASLAANPKQPEVLYNLAIIYKSQGKTKQAITELKKSIALNKQFVAAKLILGDLYLQQNQKGKAKAEYQAVIDMKPFGVDLDAVKAKIIK